MKISDMRPTVKSWEYDGKVHKVGHWSYRDGWTTVGLVPRQIRTVWHYNMAMVTFVNRGEDHAPVWHVIPETIGWGSVSDQQGCNKLTDGFRDLRGRLVVFRRAGGARWDFILKGSNDA